MAITNLACKQRHNTIYPRGKHFFEQRSHYTKMVVLTSVPSPPLLTVSSSSPKPGDDCRESSLRNSMTVTDERRGGRRGGTAVTCLTDIRTDGEICSGCSPPSFGESDTLRPATGWGLWDVGGGGAAGAAWRRISICDGMLRSCWLPEYRPPSNLLSSSRSKCWMFSTVS